MSFQSALNATDDQLILFKNAVSAARIAGVIMIAAAGNCFSPECTSPSRDELLAPARWDGVIAVGASADGATLVDELRLSYSMFDGGKVHCVAPVFQSPTLVLRPINNFTMS
jgi:hypothetical protein